MNIRHALLASLLFGCASLAHAASGDMDVSTWVEGCEHTMTTNHFELASGESVEIDLNLTECREANLGGLFYMGYKTTKNSSKPLVTRDRMRLRLVNTETGETRESTDGSLFTQVVDPAVCRLYAENTGRKTIKVRLYSRSGL